MPPNTTQGITGPHGHPGPTGVTGKNSVTQLPHTIRIKNYRTLGDFPIAILFKTVADYARWLNSGEPEDKRPGITTIRLQGESAGQLYNVDWYIDRLFESPTVKNDRRTYAMRLHEDMVRYTLKDGNTIEYLMWLIPAQYYERIR